ncbi:MAG: DUF6745 domain-containing protein [Elainella sp.]
MRKILFNGRVPSRPVGQSRPIEQRFEQRSASQEPVTPEQGRRMILANRGWEGMRVAGHLDLSGAAQLDRLPEQLTCESLDISDCVNLKTLPRGLHVTRWIELAGSGINQLPAGHGFVLHWRGVRVEDRIAFAESVTGQEILETENVELRRILIERLGYDAFLQQVGGRVRHRDQDAGGERQLIYVPFEDDEPLVLLKVICPSTGHLHVLRVPPYMRTCHQAAAWIAGFSNPDDYQPLIEG